MGTGFARVSRLERLTTRRPSAGLGFVVSVVAVGLCTAAIYPLEQVAPPVSLSVVYLPAVLLVSADWGIGLGLFTALLSAAAFNFFHITPVGRFTVAHSRDWVALAAFTVVAIVASAIAELARARALEAEQRRAEADLTADLARELLGGLDTHSALASAAGRLCSALQLGSASLVLGGADGDERRRALVLRDAEGHAIATLLVPRATRPEILERIQLHVVPPLEALVALALHRDAMQAEAVETAALRRSDDIKTALLRSVSHDLRTPLTAIVSAGHALRSRSLTEEDRAELSHAVVDEGERLANLVDKLLDLSKLQGGGAAPRREWVAVEDVVLAAADGVHAGPDKLRLSIAGELPQIRADAAQLERALANLLENALTYSNGAPVTLNASQVGDLIVLRVVDQGPGISPAERQRIFEPFYRGRRARDPDDRSWSGSGLGLAIARGFVEGNGGVINVESLPGQGTTFVISLPIEPSPAPSIVR